MPTLEITSANSLGESGLDRVVETRIVIICQLARLGTFAEADCQGRVRFERHDRHVVGEMSGGSGREGGDGSGVVADGEFGPPAIIFDHDTPKAILGSRHPHKMVSPLRVTLQPVLWKNTLQLTLHRTATERRLLTRPGS